jgi:23S rRNA (guanosine2251-2'-O)-methyltransferase
MIHIDQDTGKHSGNSKSAIRKLSMAELNRKSREDFHNSDKWRVRIILDNLRSQHNIGSVFRTADAFGAEEIYLCGICATPPNREIQKSALGATESVKWQYFKQTTDAVQKAKEDGYKIVLIEQTTRSVDLSRFDYRGEPLALVFGNEVNGVSDELLMLADAAIEIPQYGTKHSFNVSVSAGIVLYQLMLNNGNR